jgi:hypothetical protein
MNILKIIGNQIKNKKILWAQQKEKIEKMYLRV